MGIRRALTVCLIGVLLTAVIAAPTARSVSARPLQQSTETPAPQIGKVIYLPTSNAPFMLEATVTYGDIGVSIIAGLVLLVVAFMFITGMKRWP